MSTDAKPANRMRVLILLGCLALALACGRTDSTSPSTSPPPGPDLGGASESTEHEIDWEAWRERRRAERMARGDTVKVRFEGVFVSGGLPDEATLAIPLSPFDARFILHVKVSRIVEGELPEGWSSELTFAVHSPASLFSMNGIMPPEGQHVPEGQFLLTLWESPEGAYDLAIEPMDAD